MPQQHHWTSDDLLIHELKTESPQRLTEDQVKADTSFLIYALSSGYGGRKYVPQATFTKALQDLQNIRGSKTPKVFRDEIDEVLLSIPDNHLKARFEKQVSAKRTAMHRTGQVGKNAIQDRSKPWEIRLEKHKGRRVLYVSITGFPLHEDPVWNGFLERVKSNLATSDALILDLRGNDGGDDEVGLNLAELLFGRPYVHPIARQFVSQTPETIAFWANTRTLNILKLKSEGQPVPTFNSELLAKTMAKYEQAKAGKLPPEIVTDFVWKAKRDDPVLGFKKHLFILMDAECASSCESTINAFEWFPGAKRVGENTAGQLEYGNVGYAVLPVSQIQVQIPTNHNEFFDKRVFERVGIAPDIKVPAGSDALEIVLKNFL